ncbi:nucleotide cyclase, partial [Dunaliella salina]
MCCACCPRCKYVGSLNWRGLYLCFMYCASYSCSPFFFRGKVVARAALQHLLHLEIQDCFPVGYSQVMALLGGLCKEYDQRAVEMGLYTVDVIGDCYMCAANLIKLLPNHVSVTVGFAQSILQVANANLTPLGTPLRIRIGIHSGPAMSGVIGVHHLKFTLVGDTVNVASRMESTAVPNTIQLSKDAYKQLQREQLAIQSEAAEEQGLERGGFADQEMLSQVSE